MPLLYKTIITTYAPIGGKDHRIHLYSPEFTTEDQAIAFGTALKDAGLALGWRVIWRQTPEYAEILDDLGGRWYFGSPVAYISNDFAKLPVFSVAEADPDAPDTSLELPEGWPEEWRPVLESPPEKVLLVSACEGVLTIQTLAKTREILTEDETVPEDALAFEVVDAFFEDCAADNQSIWVSGPDGIHKIN